jgi:hypothetical protein
LCSSCFVQEEIVKEKMLATIIAIVDTDLLIVR